MESLRKPPLTVPMPPSNEALFDKTVDSERVNTVNSSTVDGFVEDSQGHGSAFSDDSFSTNSSDEFWQGAAKEAGEIKAKSTRAKRGRWLYLLFLRLYRPFRVLLVAIFGGAILIAPYLVVHFAFPNSVVRPHVAAWSIWLAITWGCGAAISILVELLPRITLAIIFYLFGKPPEHLTTELELFVAVSFWLKLMLDTAALWVTLAVMREILKPPGQYWVYVNRATATIFVAGILLFLEKCFLRFVSIRFHQEALADRIEGNRRALKVLDRLAHASPVKKYGKRKGHGHNKYSTSGMGSRSTSFDALNSVPMAKADQHHEVIELMEKPEPPAHGTGGKRKRRKRISVLDQVGDAISAVALKDSSFNRAGQYASLHSARTLARKLFASLSDNHPPRNLVMSDFYPYFPTREEAEDAFQLIDKDGNGDIERKEMREAVQHIYRERKSITASLKDVSSIVAKLDAILVFLCLITMIFIALLIFNRANTLTSLVPLATIVLGFSFVFGHSAQVLFESLIFIFSTHVFDVGDLIQIDDQVLFVREFGLFSTTFRRVDGQEIVAPNSLLASNKLIHNFRRSPSMWETTVLHISFNTPLELVEQLRARLKTYAAENSREWSDIIVNIDKIEYQNAIYLNISMQHKANWQDWGGKWSRRTEFMRHLKTVLEELEISYRRPIQPVILRSGSQGPVGLGRRQGSGTSQQRRSTSDKEALGNAGGLSGPSPGAVQGMTISSEPSTFGGGS